MEVEVSIWEYIMSEERTDNAVFWHKKTTDLMEDHETRTFIN